MQMLHALAGVGAIVDDDPISAGHEAGLLGLLVDDVEDVAEKIGVVFGEVANRSDMLLRDDQEMHRGPGVDILEGFDPIVLIQGLARDLAGGEAAKKAIVHSRHALRGL